MHVSVPADSGYRMPAEWEPQLGTWLSWPSESTGTDFVGHLQAPAEAAYRSIIDALLEYQDVFLNNGSLAREAGILHEISEEKRQRLHLLDITASEWCRDYGPTFLTRDDGQPGAVDWKFSAWGGKYGDVFEKDTLTASAMCESLNIDPSRIFSPIDVTLEGGAIEVNGAGTVLTTESCLLNPNRNPNVTKSDIENLLADYLGTVQVIWLNGTLEGDDTDGHIDTLARFASEDTVLVQGCDDPSDANFQVAEENLRRLRKARLPDHRSLRVIELPSPGRLTIEGIRMPASYANFLIANDCVLVPQYNVESDSTALRIIGDSFPGRETIAIDCSTIIWGRGALHCISQQIPMLQ